MRAPIPERIAEDEVFFHADQGGRHHVELGARSPLKNMASVAFGGADLKTSPIWRAKGEGIASIRAPIAGARAMAPLGLT